MKDLRAAKDRRLVHQFLNTKSEIAFLDLYRSKTPHLYQMALRLTQDEYQSEELIQEMWIVAIRKLADFEWKSELKTWLTGILINLYRSTNKSKKSEVLYSPSNFLQSEVKIVSWNDSKNDLEKAIAQLPPGYRQILILHDIEGYKHKEISNMLDIAIGTSKSQLFHARKTLREYLSEGYLNDINHG